MLLGCSPAAVKLYGIMGLSADKVRCVKELSRNDMATLMGVSKQHIGTLLKELIDFGALRKEQRTGDNKAFASSVYWLLEPKPPEKP